MVMLLLIPRAVAQVGAPHSSPSDPRASFFSGNVTTCSALGYGGDTQLGSDNNSNASDGNVTGTVATNSGSVQPGVGQEVNVTIASEVVVDAVVVKGGDGYNVYSKASFLPPTLGSPQHYISPLNGGGNVPTISHWFVCYHLTTSPPVGSITVSKVVLAPSGQLVGPPPSSYTALVSCNDGSTQTVTFGGGGGEGAPSPALEGLPLGTACTVVEQNPPSDAVVTYSPPGANTTGVTITSASAVEVTITNDFSKAPVETGTLQLEKVVNNPDELVAPATFTAQVVCDDGTNATVTMPGSGGTGTPVLNPQVGFDCTVMENSPPTGWTTTYSVDGGTPSPNPPTFTITSATTTVTVTITNRAPTTTTSSTSTTTTTTTVPSTTTTTTTVPSTTTTTTTVASSTTTTVPARLAGGQSSTTEPSTTSTTAPSSSSAAASSGEGSLAATGSDAWDTIEGALLALFVGSLAVAGSRLRKRSDM
jgi:Domain of unknown function (DUF5979)